MLIEGSLGVGVVVLIAPVERDDESETPVLMARTIEALGIGRHVRCLVVSLFLSLDWDRVSLVLGCGHMEVLGRVIAQSKETVSEEAEGAHGRDVFGIKSADDGVKGLGTHHIDPDVEGEDAAEGHSQDGSEHILWDSSRGTVDR